MSKPLHAVGEQVVRWHRQGEVQLSALPPLTLYVHLPWCLQKCPYCDFNSHEWRSSGDLPWQRYLQALRADLEASLPLVWGRSVHSVFVGGGTPSLFPPEAIDQLLSDIRSLLKLEADAEITLEANPGTFETHRFKAFRQAGVTRLSIGVQSFNDRFLKALGRVHNADQAQAAVAEAAAYFDTFNLDLMYALPSQTLADLQADLSTALSFKPPHVSVYHLTIEPNTTFANHPPEVPDDDSAYEMLDLITDQTGHEGMQRYEVSAYAREGHRCFHNWNYWQFGDYLGIGAGAHGKLSFASRIVRQVRWREPMQYMDKALQGQAVSNEQAVAAPDLPFEFMLNALRLREGFALRVFTERTGLPLSTIEPALQMAEKRGWLVRQAGQVVPTERGFDFLSDLQTLFLPE